MYKNTLKNWSDSSYLSKNNQSYIEKIYKDFLKNPDSVDSSWIKIFKQLFIEKKYEHKFFDNLTNNTYVQLENNTTPNESYIKNDTYYSNITYIQITQLISYFRTYGHQHSALDPLKLWNHKSKNHLLNLKNYNFSSKNVHKKFDMNLFGINKESMTLSEIYQFLKKTYCDSIGIEYMHILDINIMLWIQNNFESTAGIFNFNSDEKKQFLKEIIAAEGIERYLGIKFPGVKRFSLEGGDALIPMLKEVIRYSVCHHNIQEIFLGMAHRGRLNVLINILGKNPQDLFNEFSDKHQTTFGSGDVKYHQGFYSDITVNKQTVHLSLLCNPSHLEIVSPVVMGCARARIDQLLKKSTYDNNKKEHNTVLPISIHGDAAISAQGIVQETFNMSKADAYDVGGTIHIIINNQVGFTTSNIHDIRSTRYCTDIAKMIQAPIFHVNADNVDAVIYVTRIALNFRNTFKRDVVIDLVCYRRHGHNEADEPSVTQPLMYKKIRNHPTLLNIYSNILNKNGILNINDTSNIINAYREKLDKKCCILQKWQPIHIRNSLHTNNLNNNSKTTLYSNKMDSQYLKKLAYRINDIPSSITMHSRVEKIYHERIEMALGNKLFDWGAAEILAYATLLDQGISIRLSGEDAGRGTFFHRHAVIYDQNNGAKFTPLAYFNKKSHEKGSFYVWDSVLSEESTLAFEYGYASLSNNMLVIWEAQFGDFSNGAQIVIDQFISSSEQKWGQLCGLVMLLPHGYEGQGPEHSSSRIERFLQLCAEYNIYICVPSTPDQLYHILRQQATYTVKKPLIIISPKSLLRHPMVTTSLENLIHGSFKTVFNEIDDNIIPHQTNHIIMCTGKIYYDLLNQRRRNKQYNIAIIRIEQLYPFPAENTRTILNSYSNAKHFTWCQEEPKNQGAWNYIQHYLHNIIPSHITLNYVGRPDSAAPAVGFFSVHQQQQKKIIDDALNLN
ncbi:2-oxoglutarate dehydrogenase E1 component [Candidatus Blochmannia vicinus (nom. nud.)]|uniref:2-oxoglutarate dehydrogenase E1 component n=1 Tax=Candidatus Blochmannia vicinus (nom. nud.) TaxID=251540 RepID=UPI002023CFB1|nr:2-oxoglutarate dehydrogenase E1 component [Candidatus Blochmannia vicinus]URJ30306.1 2-oxoglutarate dehydrogenase E1 component [Candidatus Blochmannia vicinus]